MSPNDFRSARALKSPHGLRASRPCASTSAKTNRAPLAFVALGSKVWGDRCRISRKQTLMRRECVTLVASRWGICMVRRLIASENCLIAEAVCSYVYGF